MTSEHVTITEEVQTKDGLVTQERETLQFTSDPAENRSGNPAMSVLHPDYVPASERVYVFNEATGMSESTPADVSPPVEEEETDEDEEDLEDEEDEEEPEVVLCGREIGNGFCVLAQGHSGMHRLTA